jgi:hypothetical protein
MKRDEFFPSKYFKAFDLEEPWTLTIATASKETFAFNGKESSKCVLSFYEQGAKALIVNATNWDAIAKLHGDDTDDWLNKKIQLYASKVKIDGEWKDSISVRAPGSGEEAPSTSPALPPPSTPLTTPKDFDDEIPF